MFEDPAERVDEVLAVHLIERFQRHAWTTRPRTLTSRMLSVPAIVISAESNLSGLSACAVAAASTLPSGARRYTKSADLPGAKSPVSASIPSATAPARVARYRR